MDLRIHADRRETVLVEAGRLPWVESPEPGVERRMLERSGGEVALATSIVRYRPGASFARHVHGGGEEFLVLDGTFSDEAGDYPRGTYVRNPPGSSHAPFSREGCVIFVKLRQMRSVETETVRVRPDAWSWQMDGRTGAERASLYSRAGTRVCLVRLPPDAGLPARETPRGEEFLLVEGDVAIGGETAALGAWSWRRSATLQQPPLHSRGGALLWMKQGHL